MSVPIPSVIPSRTSGRLPLAVFFDAAGTTDSDVSSPFRDLYYQWSFGDSGAGSFAYGANTTLSKNSALGPVAAHVYESAGTYTWTLLVYDGTTAVWYQNGSITVTDWPDDANTICVGNELPVAGQNGVPSNAICVPSADATAVIAANIGTNKRILFNRGDTFSAPTAIPLLSQGPWMIGAYGNSDSRAFITTTQTAGTIFSIGATAGVFPNDGRLVGLDITQSVGTDTQSIFGAGNFDKFTMHDLRIHDIGDGPQFYAGNVDLPTNTHVWDSLFISESEIQNINGGSATHGIYLFATRFAIIGSLLDDTIDAEHLLRMDYGSKGVISSNTFSNGAAAKESIALRGVGQDVGDAYYFQYVLPTPSPTQYIINSNNKIIINAFAGLKVGPVNDATHTAINNIISQCNWYSVSGALASVMNNPIILQGTSLTVRNELLDLTGSTRHDGIYLLPASTGMAAASGVIVENCTFYSATDGTGNVTLGLGGAGSSGIFRNNIAWFPAETGTVTITTGGTWTASNNSDATQAKSTDPLFTGPLTSPAGFRYATTSYGQNAGTAVFPSGYSDFFNGDDVTANVCIGAFVPRVRSSDKGVAA